MEAARGGLELGIGRRIAGAARVLLIGWLCLLAQSAAAQDTTAPVLVSISSSPASLDVTTGDGSVTITAHFTDDSSGFASASLFYAPPDLSTLALVTIDATHLTSGDASDGTYAASLVIPEYSKSGTWSVFSISGQDAAGNPLAAPAAGVLASASFDVLSNPEIAPPSLFSFAASPPAVDVTTGTGDVAVTLRVTDDVSGVDRLTVTYESPSGAETASVVLDAADRISGDAFDGTYQGTVPIPQLGESGTWSVKTIRVVDAFGLFADLAPGSIPPPGPQTVGVSSTPDGNAPQLAMLTVTPTVVNVATGAVLVEVTARITDDVTGVTDGALLIRSPDDLSSLAVTLGPAQRISGDNLDGTYQNSVSFPQDSPRGWWGFEFFTNDAAGNGVQLTGGALPGQSGIAVTATTATGVPSLAPIGSALLLVSVLATGFRRLRARR